MEEEEAEEKETERARKISTKTHGSNHEDSWQEELISEIMYFVLFYVSDSSDTPQNTRPFAPTPCTPVTLSISCCIIFLQRANHHCYTPDLQLEE